MPSCRGSDGSIGPCAFLGQASCTSDPDLLLHLCTARAHGCEFGMVCSASGHTGGLEDAVTVTTVVQPSLCPSLPLPDRAVPSGKG